MSSPLLPLKIAWRYLFAKKSHNAINILTAISTAAIAVGTAALICILSVMNGFEDIVTDSLTAFNPPLRIEQDSGKSFLTNLPAFDSISRLPQIAVYSTTIEQTALLKNNDRQEPATIKGVEHNYNRLTHIDTLVIYGQYQTSKHEIEYITLGAALAAKLGMYQQIGMPITLYSPRRQGAISTVQPQQSFTQAGAILTAAFAVNQTPYDDRYALVSLDLARQLFQYAPHEATAIEIRLQPGANLKHTQRQIAQMLPQGYTVKNQYEQQADFYRILNIEKWLTFTLLGFILLIATFNIIGSLSMLLIEKRQDIITLSALGATKQQIYHIFHYQAMLISTVGALAGLAMGIILCLMQQHLHLITYGDPDITALQYYPVSLHLTDILATLALVFLLTLVTTYYPLKRLRQ